MSVYKLSCKVQLGNYFTDFASEIEINQSYKDLGSTCVIKLPRKLMIGKKKITEWLKGGMPVKVEYGYDGNLRTEFTGYVSRFKPSIPIEILCEDEFYQLRQKQIPVFRANGVSIGALLTQIFERTGLMDIQIAPGYDVLDFKIPIFQAGGTAMEMIEDLKEKYGLFGYFVGKVFHVGPPFQNKDASSYKSNVYKIGTNVISHDLTKAEAANIRIGVTFVANVSGKITSVTVGDQDGYKIKKTLVGSAGPTTDKGPSTPKQLEDRALAYLASIRYDGLQGKLTSFNIPLAEMGDRAEIRDPEGLFGNDYDGVYSIVSIKKTYGVGGIRREVELGPLEP